LITKIETDVCIHTADRIQTTAGLHLKWLTVTTS